MMNSLLHNAVISSCYLMMISLMPTTPCLSTSSATEKALCKGVFSGIICSSLHTEYGIQKCMLGKWNILTNSVTLKGRVMRKNAHKKCQSHTQAGLFCYMTEK